MLSLPPFFFFIFPFLLFLLLDSEENFNVYTLVSLPGRIGHNKRAQTFCWQRIQVWTRPTVLLQGEIKRRGGGGGGKDTKRGLQDA